MILVSMPWQSGLIMLLDFIQRQNAIVNRHLIDQAVKRLYGPAIIKQRTYV